ncbi:hypothetical protein SNE40_003476 [Patella caerulea]|uniref:Uncharacterized protein n=1 Tax=Patella caerulea TaxID=87958 RepID=A0AAN8Q8N2_PATCE
MVQQVTDIEEIVKSWAWTYFKKNHPSSKLSDYILEVNWDHVVFPISETTFSEELHIDVPDALTVFKSHFDNYTDDAQENVFKTERTTTASLTTTMQKGYRRGWNVGLTIPLPDTLGKFTAGYGREVTINRSTADTQTTQFKWAIDTKINAPGKKRTVAILNVEEKESSCKYKTQVTMRGEVGVRISTCLNPLNPPFYLQNDLPTILKDRAEDIARDVTFSQNMSYVTWTVEGLLSFKYAVHQNVSVRYEELPTSNEA